MRINSMFLIISLVISSFSSAADINSSSSPEKKPVDNWLSMTIPDDKSKAMFNEAKTLVNEKKLDEAILIFGKLANYSPSKGQAAHLEVGRCHIGRGDKKRAIQWIAKYGHIYGRSAESLYLLGQIHDMSQNYKKSVRCYEASLKLNNNDPKVHYALALAYDKQRNFSKSTEHAQSAMKLDSRYKKYLQPMISNRNLSRDAGAIVDKILMQTATSPLTDEQINNYANRFNKIIKNNSYSHNSNKENVNPKIDTYISNIKHRHIPIPSK